MFGLYVVEYSANFPFCNSNIDIDKDIEQNQSNQTSICAILRVLHHVNLEDIFAKTVQMMW